jgi:NADPH:quinone reductase-like Zn-dependent oxidoreductase
MQAVIIRRHGGPEVLELADRPVPVPRRGQVLVRVRASCVNPRDWLVREGRYVFGRLLPPLPFTPGSDLAGIVTRLGPGVATLREGDEVFGMQPLLGGMGAYAEYVAIAASAVALKPPSISFEQAAAFPCAGLTAWQALTRVAPVSAGHHVVVNGASGGVGTYAVQIAKALGARVTAVTSGVNAAFVSGLGADQVIDYRAADPLATARDVDVFFDAVGRASFRRARRCLSRGGRYLTTVPSVASALDSLRTAATRHLPAGAGKSSHLVLVRARSSDLAAAAELMVAGRLHSEIEQVYPLEQAAQAQARSRSWHVRGKLVLRVEAAK